MTNNEGAIEDSVKIQEQLMNGDLLWGVIFFDRLVDANVRS